MTSNEKQWKSITNNGNQENNENKRQATNIKEQQWKTMTSMKSNEKQ